LTAALVRRTRSSSATSIDPDERAIDTSKPILLSAQGEWTKQSGYYRLQPGGALERLILEDKAVGRPTKATKADRLLFTQETFTEFPDYYVSGTTFSQPIKVTDANPQQKEYAWGRRVLVDYKNSKGVRLQGTLALPANYQEGKRYPMLSTSTKRCRRTIIATRCPYTTIGRTCPRRKQRLPRSPAGRGLYDRPSRGFSG
jgi:dipeptidyl aminopeptidase/acylaminoacyl peptidase